MKIWVNPCSLRWQPTCMDKNKGSIWINSPKKSIIKVVIVSDEPIYLVLEDVSIKEDSEDVSMLDAFHEACKRKDIESIRVGEKPIIK